MKTYRKHNYLSTRPPMIRLILLSFFSVTVIASPFLFPAYAAISCDFENTPISLKAVNKPITEILKDIEKQADFNFVFSANKALNSKKTIELSQSPLNLSLKRLLKDLNYSIICNDEQKSLTLIFLDKSTPSASVASHTATKNAQVDSMAGLSAAFDDYRNNSREFSPTPQQDPKEMKGISSAMQSYKSKKNNLALPSMPHTQKTSMDAATTALEEYKFNKQNAGGLSYQKSTTSTEMDEISVAMDEYRNRDSSENTAPLAEEPTSMDGAVTAMEEYRRQL